MGCNTAFVEFGGGGGGGGGFPGGQGRHPTLLGGNGGGGAGALGGWDALAKLSALAAQMAAAGRYPA
jgi:hypothetical protein